MPTGIPLNLQGFRMSECSLADDEVVKVGDKKSFEFRV